MNNWFNKTGKKFRMKEETNKLKLFILLTVSLLFIINGESAAQTDYKFTFDKDWEWVEFIYGGHDISEEAKSLITTMSENIDLIDARIMFKNLSLLDYLYEAKDISQVALIDSSVFPNNNRIHIDTVLKNFYEPNTLNGIIFSAAQLFALRKNPVFSGKNFVKKEQLSALTDTIDVKFDLQYDYTNAEVILNLLEYDTGDYYSLLEEKTKGYTDKLMMKRDKINECFRYASKNTPLYNIYKLLFPSSFGNLGGVFVYREHFRTAIRQIKQKEDHIKFEVKHRLFQYLPTTLDLNTKVNFSFAFETKSEYYHTGYINYNIETSGNDHRLIFSNIARMLVEKAKNRTYVDILPYIFDGNDSLYAKIINAVYLGGLINYIAPTTFENRPLSLLEKDFMHFRRTCNEIKTSADKKIIDTLIYNGIQGLGLFYTMGTQMAFTIEKAFGKSGIKNSMVYGPYYFFRSYITAYYDEQYKVRQIFRFTPDFEDRIDTMGTKIPREIIGDVSNLSLQNSGPEKISGLLWGEYLITKSKQLQDNHNKKLHGYTVYLFTGELLFKNALYSESASSFLKAYPDISDKKKFFNLISQNLFNAGAYTASLEFINGFLQYNRTLLESYLMRAKTYLKLGNYEKAKQDLETVLLLEPANIEADMLLNDLK